MGGKHRGRRNEYSVYIKKSMSVRGGEKREK